MSPWTALLLCLAAVLLAPTSISAQRNCRYSDLDVFFLLDESSSIRPEDYDRMKAFCIDIIEQLEDLGADLQVAVFEFSDSTSTPIDLSSNVRSVKNQINRLEHDGNQRTNIYDIVSSVNNYIERQSVVRDSADQVVFLVTDGVNRGRPLTDVARLNEIAQVFTIGVGSEPDREELTLIASRGGFIRIDNFEALEDAANRLVRRTCDPEEPRATEPPRQATTTPPQLNEQCLGDIVFVVDRSGSIKLNDNPPNSGQNWARITRFMGDFVNDITSDRPDGTYRFAAVLFDGTVDRRQGDIPLEFSDDQTPDVVERRLRTLEYRNPDEDTNTVLGIRTAVEEVFTTAAGNRLEAAKIIVLITDGRSNVNPEDTIPEAQRAHGRGIRMLIVGITDDVEQDELQGMSSDGIRGSTYWMVPDYESLGTVVDATVENSCVVTPTDCNYVDITIMLDASKSISFGGSEDWRKMKEFTKELVQSFGITPEGVHVSLVRFSTSDSLEFDLSFTESVDIVSRIDELDLLARLSNIAYILEWVNLNIFTGALPDRPRARNVAFLVTDGRETGETLRHLTDVAAQLKRGGPGEEDDVEIFTVGVTSGVDMDQLESIASTPTREHVWTVDNYDELLRVLPQLIDEVCPEPTSPPVITVAPVVPADSCRENADVVIAIDTTDNIQSAQYLEILRFAQSQVSELDIESGDMNLGLIGYSETIDVVHNFGTLRTRADAIEAISEMEQSDFTTSMVENAINYINTQMFQPEYVRPNNGKNKVIVFLTHSRSEDIQLVFSESMDAKLQGLHVIAVPLGSDINMEEIRGLVTHPPEGNIIRANDIRNLIRSYQTELRDMICNEVDDCRRNPCSNRARCSDKINDFLCACSSNDFGKTCNGDCRHPPDLSYTFDISSGGPVSEIDFYRVTDFAKDLTEMLSVPADVRLGIQTYINSGRTHIIPLYDQRYRTNLDYLHALTLPYNGITSLETDIAIRRLHRTMYRTRGGARDGYDDVALIFTDGSSNSEAEIQDIMQEVAAAQGKDIHFICMVVGGGRRAENLGRAIASQFTNSNYIPVTVVSIERQLNEVYDLICNTVDDCRSRPCRNGATCMDHRGGYSCVCTPEFTGPICDEPVPDPCRSDPCYNDGICWNRPGVGPYEYECNCTDEWTGRVCRRPCSGMIDLTFIFDSSNTNSRGDFERIKQFAISLTRELEVRPEKTRVSAISFHRDPTEEFFVMEFDEKEEVIEAIEGIQWEGVENNLADAMDLLRRDTMTGEHALRHVPHIVFVFTDGHFNLKENDVNDRARDAKQNGAKIICISAGGSPDLIQLSRIASHPAGDNILKVTSISRLPSLLTRAIARTCGDARRGDRDNFYLD